MYIITMYINPLVYGCFSSQYVNVAENGSNQPTIAMRSTRAQLASPSRAICRNDDYYYYSVCNADALLMMPVAVGGAVRRVVKV